MGALEAGAEAAAGAEEGGSLDAFSSDAAEADASLEELLQGARLIGPAF